MVNAKSFNFLIRLHVKKKLFPLEYVDNHADRIETQEPGSCTTAY